MKSKLAFIVLSSAIVLSIVIMFAVSIQKKDGPDPIVISDTAASLEIAEVPDTVTDPVDQPEEQLIPFEFEPEETLQVSFADVRDVAFWKDRIAAGTSGGVFTYRLSDSSYQFYHYGDGLTDYEVQTILPFQGKLIVGTATGLFEIDQSGDISRIDFGYQSSVTALTESRGTLLIGTKQDGLIAYWDGSSNQLLDVDDITSIVSAGDQIWVATDGNGLHSFDGLEWKRRFLIRDTTAFDYVTDLGYRFNRLFAGTHYGLWVFDGGRWKLYDEDDCLTATDVTQVDFLGWKIVVGTRGYGVYEIFEDIVATLNWSENMEVTALAANENTLVVGTPDQGIYIAEGKSISHINPTSQSFTRPIIARID